jgi:tRNA(adenine34) deaminase
MWSPEDQRWMARAMAWARLGASRSEVPIGAVVVLHDELLGGAHDGKELFKDPTAHAEMLALREAAARIGDWRLDGATLYVTLEPCAMCAGAMIHARLARVVYAASNPRWGVCHEGHDLQILNNPRFNHRLQVESGLMEAEAATLLRETFRRYRH